MGTIRKRMVSAFTFPLFEKSTFRDHVIAACWGDLHRLLLPKRQNPQPGRVVFEFDFEQPPLSLDFRKNQNTHTLHLTEKGHTTQL
jgi:hypothetical protein